MSTSGLGNDSIDTLMAQLRCEPPGGYLLTPKRRYATRLNSFRSVASSTRSVEEAIAAVAAVPGISAIELNFPQHGFTHAGKSVISIATAVGLRVTALNMRFDSPEFSAGAFTHPDPGSRGRAIALCCDAVDLAASEGIDHVILWMGPDGYDYPFQADYRQLWEMEVDGFARVATHRPDVRVSVEYKPSDPRRASLIRTMSDSLLAVRDVGLPNFGVTLDFCHALMTGENPAAAAAMALREGKLFGVHLNDGHGPADDGLMVGSVHPWHTLELLRQLRLGDFPGTIYFDTFPERVDPAAECAANIRTVELFDRILDRVDPIAFSAMQAGQDAVGLMTLMQSLAMGGELNG